MKKTFPANINGTVFYIDEDAYDLLNNYLRQLRSAFPGDEGKEITSDIEARIAELFGEKIACGSTVITIDDVEAVISKMGRPADLADSEPDDSATQPTPPPFDGVKKKLYRNMQNKVFGGVLSGVACYFGWNTNILRLLVAILALCTYVWPLIVAYLIAWMVIPAAVTPRQVLEMNGAPVTIDSVFQTVIGTSGPNASQESAGLLGVLGKIVLIALGVVAGLIVVVMLGIFISMICGLILWWGWGSHTLLDHFSPDFTNPSLGFIGSICLALCIALPCIAIMWATCCVVFKVKGMTRNMLIGGLIVEVLLIIAATVMLSVATLPVQMMSAATAATTTLLAMC